MNFADRAADRLARGLALLASIGVILMLLHVTVDVASRNFADQPIPATNEIVSRYYMVAIAFLPLAWVERKGAMVKVELTDFLTSDRVGRWNDGLVAILAVVIYLALFWVMLGDAVDRFRAGSFTDVLGYQIATWPSYFLPPLGFLAAALTAILRAIGFFAGRAPA